MQIPIIRFLFLSSLFFAGAAQAQERPRGAIPNYMSSLIYNAMTEAPVWQRQVRYTSRESHRNSYVRKQGTVTCTAMMYIHPQGRLDLQNVYSCELGNASILGSRLRFSGIAAELLYGALAKNLSTDWESTRYLEAAVEIPGVGPALVRRGNRSVSIQLTGGDFGATRRNEIDCERIPGPDHQQVGGEFDEALAQGFLNDFDNQYFCTIPI